MDELYVVARRVLLDALDALGEHRDATILVGAHAARKVDGLEGVLVDLAEHDIASLEPAVDPRVVRAKVAGPGALLVAKMLKIHERRGAARANDKDALDVLRILQGISTEDLARRLTSILARRRPARGAQALTCPRRAHPAADRARDLADCCHARGGRSPFGIDASLSRGLDRAGAYSPGHGHLDLFGYVKPDAAGGGLDYAHRITGGLSAFAQGWGGVAKDPFGRWQPDYGALGGLRWRW